MIKRFSFILLILFLSVNIRFPTTAYASNAIKTNDDLNNLVGDGKYLGDNYRDNYYLDIEKTDIFEAGDYMLNQIANALFSIIRILGFAVSVFFYRVMTFDVSEVFSTEINSIQSALKLSIFDGFFMLAFAASAWNLMKKITKRDLSGLVTEIGKILCIFLLASFVVTHSATALSATTSITKDISVSALMNINQQGDIAVESYAANASGMIWKSLVHAPWKSLEFESGSDDDSHVEDFLNTPPGTSNRTSLVESYRGEYPNAMLKSKGVGRIGFLIVYLIPFLVKSGIYMLMAILQLAFQVMAVFYILLAPVILLLSLIPAFGGIELVTSWLKKILETQIMMLIITFILGIIISLDNFLYAKSNDYGWFIVIFMETLVALVVVINHKSILSGLSKMTTSVRQSGALKTQLQRSGDVFGALGSGNGIRNLSPTKRYVEQMNRDNNYKKFDVLYSPYSSNYNKYTKHSDNPKSTFDQEQNIPKKTHHSPHSNTNIADAHTLNMPIQKGYDIPRKQMSGNNHSKIIPTNTKFNTSGNSYENPAQLILQRPYNHPKKKQPDKLNTETTYNPDLYDYNSNKIAISNQADNVNLINTDTNKVTPRPPLSVKPEADLTTLSTPISADMTANITKRTIKRPVSSVKPKNKPDTVVASPISSTPKHTNTTTNITEKPIEIQVSSVKPKNEPITTVNSPNITGKTKDVAGTNAEKPVRPASSVKTKDEAKPDTSTYSHKLTTTSDTSTQKQHLRSSVQPKKKSIERNKHPDTVRSKNIRNTT